MFEVFRNEMQLIYPEATVSLPVFEPVVGCVVLRCMQDGRSVEEIRERLTAGFAEFLYR